MKILKLFIYALFANSIIMWAMGQTQDANMVKETDAFYDKTLIPPLRSAWIWGKYGK